MWRFLLTVSRDGEYGGIGGYVRVSRWKLCKQYFGKGWWSFSFKLSTAYNLEINQFRAEFIISRQPWTLVSFSQQDLSRPGVPGRSSRSHSRVYHVQAPLDGNILLTAWFIMSTLASWSLISQSGCPYQAGLGTCRSAAHQIINWKTPQVPRKCLLYTPHQVDCTLTSSIIHTSLYTHTYIYIYS